MVGIVVVSHSRDIASGTADLAGQMAGPDVRIGAAGGDPAGGLGTDGDRVRSAIADADAGDGVARARRSRQRDPDRAGGARGARQRPRALADAPLVEGAVAAAVAASAGLELSDVLRCAEEASGASKL